MAKKRKKTDAEKEEKEYQPPEFDEREFIAEEINIARAVILGAILSVPVGIAAFFVAEALGSSFGGLIVAILGIVLIKMLMPMFKVDEIMFKPKHWLSVISTYFFAFLAVWILMVNPPFNDYAGPQVMQLDVELIGTPIDIDGNMTDNITYITVIENGTTSASQINITTGWLDLTIKAEITDNKELNVNTVMIDTGTGAVLMDHPEGDLFTFSIASGDLNPPTDITISSLDANGNNSTFTFRILQP